MCTTHTSALGASPHHHELRNPYGKILRLCTSHVATSFCDIWSLQLSHPDECGVPLPLDFHHLMVMEPSDWCCPCPLSAAMSQQIFLHKSLYLSSCASGVKTTTKNCGCRWVSVVYFRLARRGGVLHGCSPVEYCRYFSVSAFSFFQHLQCVIFRCTMNGGEGFWNTFGCQWLFTRCWCLSSSIHTSLSRSLGCGRTWRAWMRASESFWLISLFSLDFSVQCESSLPSYGAKPIMRPSPGTDGFKSSVCLQYLYTLLSPNTRYLHCKTYWFRRVLKTKTASQVPTPYLLLEMICDNVSWQEQDLGVQGQLSGLLLFFPD